LYYIQRSLGHSDIYTTQIYAYVSQRDLKEKIEKAFTKQKTAESHQNKNQTMTSMSDPLEILKIRFANGDITVDELKEKIEVLNALSKSAGIF
jgi:hypothetical protein